MSILGIGNFSQLKFTYTPFYYRARCDVKQEKRQKRRCLAKASLVKGRCRACEAQGFPVARGCDGQSGKARRNPSVRLRRPPPFDKGGFCLRGGAPRRARGMWCDCPDGAGRRKRARRPEGWPPYVPLFWVGCRAGCPHPAEVGGRQNVTGLAGRRGGFHIRPWECP